MFLTMYFIGICIFLHKIYNTIIVIRKISIGVERLFKGCLRKSIRILKYGRPTRKVKEVITWIITYFFYMMFMIGYINYLKKSRKWRNE